MMTPTEFYARDDAPAAPPDEAKARTMARNVLEYIETGLEIGNLAGWMIPPDGMTGAMGAQVRSLITVEVGLDGWHAQLIAAGDLLHWRLSRIDDTPKIVLATLKELLERYKSDPSRLPMSRLEWLLIEVAALFGEVTS